MYKCLCGGRYSVHGVVCVCSMWCAAVYTCRVCGTSVVLGGYCGMQVCVCVCSYDKCKCVTEV